MGHFGTISARWRGTGFALAAAALAPLLLAGCGGIQFEGKVFDYTGISSLGQQKEDVKMTERAPLLVPPNPGYLPPPGSPSIARADWPVDTSVRRKQLAEQKAEAEKQRAIEADPNNPYAGKPNLLDNLLGRRKKVDDDPSLDVPEPDPSDKTPEDRQRERTVVSAPQPTIDHTLNAPPPEDPFKQPPPDSYQRMSNPSGNDDGH